ncbi:MAG: hypothetical protein AAGI50_02140 [Pseudomonadota bacterium]
MAHIPFDHTTSRRDPRWEYGLYFGLVFTISLIPALFRMVAPKKGEPRRFFVTHARQMASEVTPLIFSA